jgi:hypothetical protein
MRDAPTRLAPNERKAKINPACLVIKHFREAGSTRIANLVVSIEVAERSLTIEFR